MASWVSAVFRQGPVRAVEVTRLAFGFRLSVVEHTFIRLSPIRGELGTPPSLLSCVMLPSHTPLAARHMGAVTVRRDRGAYRLVYTIHPQPSPRWGCPGLAGGRPGGGGLMGVWSGEVC